MIEPAVRDAPLRAACADTSTAVVLLDCVIGHGASADPAGHLAAILDTLPATRPVIIASVTGTKQDRQNAGNQRAILGGAGVVVAHSNAEAARLAIRHISN